MSWLLPLRPLAALVAALALFTHYALHAAHGLQTGGVLWDAMDSALGSVDGPVFTLFYFGASAALLGVFVGLGGQQRGPGAVGAAFATLALAAAALGGSSFLIGRMVPFAMPVATLSLFLSALLLGTASLRAGTLPAGVGWLLVWFGLTTIPLATVLPMAGERLGAPGWAMVEAHFVLVGLEWLVLARGFHREAHRKVHHATPLAAA